MRKLLLPAILGALFLVGACQKSDNYLSTPAPMAESKMMMQSADGFAETRSEKVEADKEVNTRLLAYIYRLTFALPAKNLAAVSNTALKECSAAGIDNCQIVTSSINTFNEDNVEASINLRVKPDWYEAYKKSLLGAANEAGGKVLNATTSAEDLTIQISDSGAKLKALKTLRGRLLTLLEKKGSTVKDLVEVERELARVQGQIEASTARLRVLSNRVSMSEVYLSYQSKSVAASRSKFASIGYALNNFLETVSGGIAAIIYFVAFILPWLIFGLPILWLIRKWWRKRKKTRV